MMGIANYFNHDATVEESVIERLVKEIAIDMVLEKVYAYRDLKTLFL